MEDLKWIPNTTNEKKSPQDITWNSKSQEQYEKEIRRKGGVVGGSIKNDQATNL